MTLMEELEEKYEEGRNGDFEIFLKYLADHEPCKKEDSKDVCEFLSKNLTWEELIDFALLSAEKVNRNNGK